MSDKPEATHDGHREKPASAAKDAVSQAGSKLKELLPSVDLGVLLSVFDGIIDNTAETAGDWLKNHSKQNPWLTSEFTAVVVSFLSGLIEKSADSHKDPTKGILKKVADWFKSLASQIRDQHTPRSSKENTAHGGAKVSHDVSAETSATQEFLKLDLEYLRGSQEALAKCNPADVEALRACIILNAETRESLKKLIEEGLPKPEVTHTPEVETGPKIGAVITKDIIRPLSHQLKRWVKEKENEAKRAKEDEARKLQHRQVPFGWMEEVLNRPVRIGVLGTTLIVCAFIYVMATNNMAPCAKWLGSAVVQITNGIILSASVSYCIWKRVKKTQQNPLTKPQEEEVA